MKTKICLSFLTLTSLVVSTQTANAQAYQPSDRTPVSDNTLGTQVSGNGNNFNITGGLNKGQTLFHSFSDFSVPTNGQANFTNPVGNRDIITRVTGGVFSDINGLVNTNGANFFLINPNGIVFGTNARLNVGKAFVGSTANSIDLVDAGGRMITFGSNPNGDAPLLSIAPNVLFDVSRLTMGGGNGQISNFGTLQTNNPSQYIGLIGGNVSMNGGEINAPGGRVELGGLSSVGTVALGVDGNNLRAQFPTNVGRGDISVTNGARVNVAGAGGGDIAISARNLEILGRSNVLGGIEEGLGTPGAVAGDIKLNATGDIVVASNSLIFNDVRLNSKGQGGNLTIDTGSLSLRDGAQLSSSTAGTGNAGNVTVTAKDAVALVNGDIFSTVEAGGVGKGGTIDINAGSLSLNDGARILTLIRSASDTQPSGQGDAGNISVKVTGTVDIAGKKDGLFNGMFSGLGIGAKGNSGNITIDAGALYVKDGAQVSVSTSGYGDAGNVNVTVKNAVSLVNNADISSAVDARGFGNGGNITIFAGSVSLKDGARLSASTSGLGNAGNVTVAAKDAVSLVNGDIFSTVAAGSVGKGGTIDIDAGSLLLKDGGQIDTSTLSASATQPAGLGSAGNVTVKVSGAVDIAGINGKFPSGIRSTIDTGTKGNGGNITVDAGSFSLSDGAELTASTYGTGNAGNVAVTAKDAVSLINGEISVNAVGQLGSAGNILLKSKKLSLNKGSILAFGESGQNGSIYIKNTDLLLMRNDSLISTRSGNSSLGGRGGDILISTPFIIALPGNNDIRANAYTGGGATLLIDSPGLFGIQYTPQGQDSLFTNDITTDGVFGQSETIIPDDPAKANQLPNTTIDASNQISQVCSANNRQNKLTVTGRGGLPPNANDPLTSDVVWQDARAASSQPTVSSTTTHPGKLPPPAVGWVFDGKGKVTLIAAGTQGQPTGTQVVCPK